MFRVPTIEEALVLQKRADLYVKHVRLRYFFGKQGLLDVTRVTPTRTNKRLEIQYTRPSGVYVTDYSSLNPELQQIMDTIPLEESFVLDLSVELPFESVPLLVEEI